MFRYAILAAAFALIAVATPATAQEAEVFTGSMPALDASQMDDTTPVEGPIRITPDGPAIIRFSEDAGSVIVGNPAHASAVLESPRQIMLMPGAPGATKVIALNREGKTIFNRSVVVGGGSGEYMRINRNCMMAGEMPCAPASIYYCPDRCYETSLNAGTGEGGCTQSSMPMPPMGGSASPANPMAGGMQGYMEPQ